MPSARLLVLLALVPAGLAGCGTTSSKDNTKDFSGDKKAVAQVVDDLSDATQKKDDKKICTSILSTAAAGRLKQGSKDCRDIVHDQLKDADDDDIDVKSVDVRGDQATAQVVSQQDGDDHRSTLQFVRQGRSWRISGLGS